MKSIFLTSENPQKDVISGRLPPDTLATCHGNHNDHGDPKSHVVHPGVPEGIETQTLVEGEWCNDGTGHQQLDAKDAVHFADEAATNLGY